YGCRFAFFFSSRRRHTSLQGDWSSDVSSSDLPGTVGATEGAIMLQDGRMLTLDTCLSDLHALGVVMDLRFREDFPPSADDLAREIGRASCRERGYDAGAGVSAHNSRLVQRSY